MATFNLAHAIALFDYEASAWQRSKRMLLVGKFIPSSAYSSVQPITEQKINLTSATNDSQQAYARNSPPLPALPNKSLEYQKNPSSILLLSENSHESELRRPVVPEKPAPWLKSTQQGYATTGMLISTSEFDADLAEISAASQIGIPHPSPAHFPSQPVFKLNHDSILVTSDESESHLTSQSTTPSMHSVNNLDQSAEQPVTLAIPSTSVELPINTPLLSSLNQSIAGRRYFVFTERDGKTVKVIVGTRLMTVRKTKPDSSSRSINSFDTVQVDLIFKKGTSIWNDKFYPRHRQSLIFRIRDMLSFNMDNLFMSGFRNQDSKPTENTKTQSAMDTPTSNTNSIEPNPGKSDMASGLTQRRRNFNTDDEELVDAHNYNSSSNDSIDKDRARQDSEKNKNEDEDDADGKGYKQNKLTLLEEVLLMGLKDSQVLRGCIIIELALRNRINTVKEVRKRPYAERLIEVIDERPTGEVLLDEALKLIKLEKQSIGNWIDLMSGETWNLMKIGYQLKQVRERIAKGLVDKGVLRTEKRNFVLFDMATHPVSDHTTKEQMIQRTVDALLSRGPPPDKRTVALACAAYAANVLENALTGLTHTQKETAFQKVDEMLQENAGLTEKAKALGTSEIVAGTLSTT
ncbi:hypothetical protein HK096_002625 [Nowakowskiella sp. JEL0078]|nr:hypothetical protein HK096_002625 [Nowakowskiella sp. JEL0078]